MRILLIEDEAALAKGVKRGLEQAYHVVDTARDGVTGLSMALQSSYALIVLDLMLPGMDGMRVCEELRAQRRSVPILMLTAKGAVGDRVRGLQSGADDYLPKPFDYSELLARIEALLRRDKLHKKRVVQIADLTIDTGSRRVARGSDEITLTNREYLLLEALATREGTVLSRETIQDKVWNDDDSFSNVVDVCVGQLRKKIDADRPVKLIQTVRGLGYTVRMPTDEDAVS